MTTQTLTPEELAFIAEGSLVGVVPTVPVEELHLLSGTVGPLMPQVPARVPLWLAVYLAKRNQCVLKPPEWLSRKSLEVRREGETREEVTMRAGFVGGREGAWK